MNSKTLWEYQHMFSYYVLKETSVLKDIGKESKNVSRILFPFT